MNITIGKISLTKDNAPRVSLKYDYYTAKNNVIIGGKKIIEVKGSVLKSEEDSELSGADVMAELKDIREAGREVACVNVSIPGYYSGMGRIESINIEQGNDPAWINRGDFSITVYAPLDSIPPNSLNISASDRVKSITFSEKIEIGEDAHGYVYTEDNRLSKAYVRFSSSVSVELELLCDKKNTKTAIENIVKKFMKTAPEHDLLKKYRSWNNYLQDRSFEMTSNNSATFSSTSILTSPSSRSLIASVDLDFKHEKIYDSLSEKKNVSGNITGLVSAPWTEIVRLTNSKNASKINNAESALSAISTKYNNIENWDGIDDTELFLYPNCPAAPPRNPGCSALEIDPEKGTTFKDCLKPISSTVTRNRTEGSINFNFEWSNKDCRDISGQTIEYLVEDQLPQPTIVEQQLPTIGVFMQDINCYSARKIVFTSTLTYSNNNCIGLDPNNCDQPGKLEKFIQEYFTQNRLAYNDYLLIQNTLTKNNTSDILRKGFISKCLYQP